MSINSWLCLRVWTFCLWYFRFRFCCLLHHQALRWSLWRLDRLGGCSEQLHCQELLGRWLGRGCHRVAIGGCTNLCDPIRTASLLVEEWFGSVTGFCRLTYDLCQVWWRQVSLNGYRKHWWRLSTCYCHVLVECLLQLSFCYCRDWTTSWNAWSAFSLCRLIFAVHDLTAA